MPDDDVRLVLARLEGMLQATLPQHAARLDEHDRALTNLAAIVTQQGQDISAVKAVASERATDGRTTRPWVAVAALVVSGLIGIGALFISLIPFLKP